MKSRFGILAALALAGCATQAPLPVMPTIADVEATQSQLSSISDPQGFFRTAAAQIMVSCGGYFDQLVSIAQRNAQTSSQVTGATQALSAILGLAQAAPGPISVIGVVGPAVTGAIANAQAGMPGGDHPAEMSTLVAAQMNAYLAAIGNPPADAPSAWLAAYGLFRTCSPAGIEAAKQQALADAPNHIVVTQTAPQALLASPAEPLIPKIDRNYTNPMHSGVPLVMVHTHPPPATLVQAIPDAQIRKMRSEWLAIQRRGGRNAAEAGPRALPDVPHPVIEPLRTDTPAPTAAELTPMAVAPLPPPLPAAPAFQPTLPDRNFFGVR